MRYFGCRLYGQASRFDKALKRLQQATDGRIDLTDSGHVDLVLQWLRDWGVRPLRKDDNAFSAQQMAEWYTDCGAALPAFERTLHELSDAEVHTATEVYEALAERQAAWRRHRNGTLGPVKFGPTAAAKTMYALRPNAFVPWDDPIRKRFGWDGLAASYMAALVRSRETLNEAAQEAATLLQRSVSVEDLPALVGRPESAPPKLVDEHDWARITSGFEPPTHEEVDQWREWTAASPQG